MQLVGIGYDRVSQSPSTQSAKVARTSPSLFLPVSVFKNFFFDKDKAVSVKLY
jgi:hypothetical protein